MSHTNQALHQAGTEVGATWSRIFAFPTIVARLASTADVPDLTAASTTMDGQTIVEGDVIFLKDQSPGSENLLYIASSVGASTCVLTRIDPFAAGEPVPPGQRFYIAAGTANGGKTFQVSNTSAGIVGTTVLTVVEEANAGTPLVTRTVTVGHADLTDAVNGEAQVINIGAVLPANAVVVAHEVNVATLFSGGSVSAVTLDIGGTDDDAIVSNMDVFTGAATGALSPRTGAHAQGKFSAEQLVATFTPDGGHALLALTAGALTITIWYAVVA